jgi:HEAT repeat protein
MNARGEMNTLVTAMGDANEEVRRTAIWAIGTIGTRTAPGGLVDALKDNDQEVRVVAAWALGEIADPATATALTNAFTSEKDGEVRSAELRALALMGKDTPALIESAITSKDTDLRRQAISMLAGKSGTWPWPWPWPRPRPSP